MSLTPNAVTGSPQPPLTEMEPNDRGLFLIHSLIACGHHVASGNHQIAIAALDQISQLAAVDGDNMQRIATYFAEALAQRVMGSWPGIHRALNASRITFFPEELSVRKAFLEMLPFMKSAFLLADQAILEAMEGERMVHVIDLNATDPQPWIVLMHNLHARPDGPPHLRFTGVYGHKEVLDHTAHVLSQEAEILDIPFQFNPVVGKLDNLDIDMLDVRTGEALAICSSLQLHPFLAENDSPSHSLSSDSASSSTLTSPTLTKMDHFLTTLRSLSPKVMVVIEHDSNHNGATLQERLVEALHSYASFFDCLDLRAPGRTWEKLRVEKMLFGEEINNIVACEGAERKVRHERVDKWVRRLETGGFVKVALGFFGMLQAKGMMEAYGGDGFRMTEEDGCVLLGWYDRPLFSVSAWRCRD